ncbi:capsid protein [Sewage-associated circular DNA virus-1]|uniref:capsid protein n=1 Tax=Sewage-associated circular DNA virus-1 TaxID=1519385 RepID=UPI0004D0F24C|nr:capsid protein [Sewage-associated circular DNA virus-1]AIF34795.1 capsid protein [Sewage-associated circular DNA virus-1]
MSKYMTPKNVARVINFAQQAKRTWDSPGMRTVRAAGKAARSRIAANRLRGKKSKGFGGPSSGHYVGPFKRPKPVKKNKIADYLSQGVCEYKEIHGNVSDPDCVYATFSTWDDSMVERQLYGALLRKLLKKAGINIDRNDQVLPMSQYNNSGGTLIQAVFKSVSGSVLIYEDLLGGAQSIQSIVSQDLIKVGLWFKVMVKGQQSLTFPDQSYQLESLSMYGQSTTHSAERHCLAQLNVMQEVLQIEMFLEISIQNRTKGAIAGTGDTETDRVDSQPLQGKLYEFNGGVPKERQKGNGLLTEVEALGISLNRAAQIGNEYKEPPPAKHFSNVSKVANQKLQPGSIKRHYLKWYARGFVNNLVNRWSSKQNPTFGQTVVASPGKCAMFAFEEVLNSGSSNLITVSYEVDKKCGAKLITAKAAPMKPLYTSDTYSSP